jgi:hypothetical protein
MTILISVLTTLAIVAILNRGRNKKPALRQIRYSQSTIYGLVKNTLPTNAEFKNRKPSQSQLNMQEKLVRIITAPDGKSYWVKDNKFYWARIEDGQFHPSLGKEIDTTDMSKQELDKLLIILDKLKQRN